MQMKYKRATLDHRDRPEKRKLMKKMFLMFMTREDIAVLMMQKM